MVDNGMVNPSAEGVARKVAVVGCGAIGLTTALAIQNILEDVNVTIFANEFSPNTTSDIAAGYWQPYLVGNTPPDKIRDWARITYDYLLTLWKEGKAAEAGITLVPAIYLVNEEPFELPDWITVTLGYSQFTKDQLAVYSKRLGQNFVGGFTFLSFTWEASIFLPYFQRAFSENRGKIVKRNIKSLSELKDFDVIVNCTGLGSHQLLDDHLVTPIRGQVIRIKAPWIYHVFNWTVAGCEEPCYIIPNTHSVVLGGTKQENDYNLNVEVSDKVTIIRNCSKVVPAIKSAEIIKHQVGLRPGRDSVRLEAEIKRNEKTDLKIVHCYGHGGGGITLAKGCAKEAAHLVREILANNIKNKL